MPSSDISVTPITEAQAEREVASAKRMLQRARRKLDAHASLRADFYEREARRAA